MASLNQVLVALKGFIVNNTNAVYANVGKPQIATLQSRTVILGWPSRNQLKELLEKGKTVISIFPPKGMEKNVTAYPPIPMQIAPFTLELLKSML